MIKLQNDYTTPEQSKRLLELGVPADSADCVNYISPTCDGGVYVSTDAIQIPHGSTFSGYSCSETYPIWSVGRLIEIYNTCVDFDLDNGAAIVIFIQDESPVVQMMEMFEDKVGIMDFSKLEE